MVLRFVKFSSITFKYRKIVKKQNDLLSFDTSYTVSLYRDCTNEYSATLVHYIT